MRYSLLGIVFLQVLIMAANGVADEVDLSALHVARPRLFLPDLDLAQLKQAIGRDKELAKIHHDLTLQATSLLNDKPVERVLIGPRLLQTSRKALRRISLLAGLYRLDGDERFADRAIQEMLAVAKFSDWNPSHFLDVAEMTNAMGIGYDWLFDRMTPEQRTTIRTAIVEKGLKPGVLAFEGKAKGFQWPKSRDNWNQVCCGGLTVGALAVADEEPDIARRILTFARDTISTALASFSPDGGWQEGPGYWAYATQYTAYFFASLHSALSTDWELSDLPGLAQAGEFRIHSIGPTGLYFNFADAREWPGSSAAMMYLAHRYDRPDFFAHEMAMAQRVKGGDRDIFHLLWHEQSWKRRANSPAAQPSQPLDAYFRHVEAVFMRSGWDDPNATFVGFKGGDNRAGHAHLDLGTFVLDMMGQRLAIDLGPDDYNLPQYFGAKRWTYHRLRTEGQNTIVVRDENQAIDAKAPLVAFASKPHEAFAVADLSATYPDRIKRALRGIKLFGKERRSVWIQDDVDPVSPIDLNWTMHTTADVQREPHAARLGGGVLARVLEPADGRFEILPASPPAPQNQNEGVKKLLVQCEKISAPTRIVVVFLAPEDTDAPLPDVTPLDDWIKAAPVSRDR